ncbi:hypothetical protein GCM10027059_11990 [Myceligenerans halotolerans]
MAETNRREAQRDAIDDMLARMEAKHGPSDESEVSGIIKRPAVSSLRDAATPHPRRARSSALHQVGR